jgi:NAD(P)-dependent dehydrogenase (short-subunit alcohol dehydrogenase family)
MLLKDKVAVIYGAGGAIGGAVARAFAREGAELFLTGRLRAPVDAVAKEIVAAGGSAEAAEVDALDEQAVDRHLQSVIERAGRVDISFNAVGIPNTKIVGVPSGRAGCRAVLPADRGLHEVVLSDRTPCRKAHDSE